MCAGKACTRTVTARNFLTPQSEALLCPQARSRARTQIAIMIRLQYDPDRPSHQPSLRRCTHSAQGGASTQHTQTHAPPETRRTDHAASSHPKLASMRMRRGTMRGGRAGMTPPEPTAALGCACPAPTKHARTHYKYPNTCAQRERWRWRRGRRRARSEEYGGEIRRPWRLS